MADTAGTCEICLNSFNEVDRKSFPLLCGHDFCLTCLVRQKNSDDYKCAKCQGNWEAIQLPALVEKKRDKVEALCKKHDFPFVYWCNSKSALYCKKCVTEQEFVELELVEDAVLLIKADIIEKVDDIIDEMDYVLHFVDEQQLDLKERLLGVQSFVKELQKLEKILHECSAGYDSLVAEKSNLKIRAQKIKEKTANVDAETDVAVVLESRAEVDDLPKVDSLPDTVPNHILCDIVSSYLDVKPLNGGMGGRYSFISKFINASDISLLELRAAISFSESLEDGAEWCSDDNGSRFGVLLALSDERLKPSCLTFRKRCGPYYNCHVNVIDEVATLGKDCEFKAEFLTSFLHMESTVQDQKGLESLLANSSLRLVTFVGHLDPASIAKLPPTIRTLGLAIKTAAEAEAVSNLCPWELLDTLHVCVGEDISVDDLRPLPRVHTKILHFNFEEVDRMRPALNALIPPQQEQYGCVQLHLPISEVRIEEALRLAEQLRGSPINKGIIIESCTGVLTETQRQQLVTAFLEAAAGDITVKSYTEEPTEMQRQKLVTVCTDAAAGGISLESCAGELTLTQRQKLKRAFVQAVYGSISIEELTETQGKKLVRAFKTALAVSGGATFQSCAAELIDTQRQKLLTEFREAVASDITWRLTKSFKQSPSPECFFN